jgi:hypothetical protein
MLDLNSVSIEASPILQLSMLQLIDISFLI